MRTDLQDRHSIESFEAGDVDTARFDHEAHIYVGWLFMRRFERAEAIARFDAALRRLTEKVGTKEKYNAMITWLFLLLIDERAQEGDDWPTFYARNTDLFAGVPSRAA